MKRREVAETEALLRERETWYVAAGSRFLNRSCDVWTLRDTAGDLSSLLIYSKQTLMPVFRGRREIPPPKFLCGFFSAVPIHSVQGLRSETIVLENALKELGRLVAENIDFDLMHIDRPPDQRCHSAGPVNLILRKPQYTDMDALAALQAAYEQEEVLPKAAEFNAAVSRLNAQQILSREQILVAELGGRLVGKINTSALSFTRFQVGGVYVHPDFRGLGIGRRMAAEFIRSLIAQGRGVTLFVKKSNIPARKVYQRLGFQTLGDYRISYYE
ncbi:hypothetical protein AGMMS50293_29910 [Spirochaetia bacterium]|nr:hypothetical protein AGMMS50293_29910 [Spirochaetia bacterium]